MLASRRSGIRNTARASSRPPAGEGTGIGVLELGSVQRPTASNHATASGAEDEVSQNTNLMPF
jgi:hypothetical protein